MAKRIRGTRVVWQWEKCGVIWGREGSSGGSLVLAGA